MMTSPDKIAYQLATKLTPPGAINGSLTSSWRKFWLGAAEELSRIYGRVSDMLREVHPLTTDELLEDWEEEYGLPDPCVTSAQTVADRRQAVMSRRVNVGGQSRAYFISLAAGIGLNVAIVEERPFEIGSSGMGDGIGGSQYLYTWSVIAPASATAAQREFLECTLERLGPAYIELVFFYQG